MADPIGSIGVTSAQESDLDLGPKFMVRLQQLADATDAHEQAFAKLQVGQNAKAGFDQAQQAEAESMRSQAAKTLAEAKAKADAEIAKANTQLAEADQIVANASALEADAAKRLHQVKAREQAASEAIAKAERAEAAANRARHDFQRRVDYLQTRLQEIAA